jgi:hypothetical protein
MDFSLGLLDRKVGIMRYFTIRPEVAGGWGANTVATISPGEPDVLYALDYEFDDWFGDDLLKATLCYIVTERLAANILRAGLSGVVFDQVTISKSGIFEDLYPEGRTLPKFLWMKVEGESARDDFGITSDLELVISEHALSVLRSGGQLFHATIKLYEKVGLGG